MIDDAGKLRRVSTLLREWRGGNDLPSAASVLEQIGRVVDDLPDAPEITQCPWCRAEVVRRPGQTTWRCAHCGWRSP